VAIAAAWLVVSGGFASGTHALLREPWDLLELSIGSPQLKQPLAYQPGRSPSRVIVDTNGKSVCPEIGNQRRRSRLSLPPSLIVLMAGQAGWRDAIAEIVGVVKAGA